MKIVALILSTVLMASCGADGAPLTPLAKAENQNCTFVDADGVVTINANC